MGKCGEYVFYVIVIVNTIAKCSTKQCSVTCGSGYKTRSAVCVQNNKVVNSNECDAQTKPKDVYSSSCQLGPCWRQVLHRHVPPFVSKVYNA